MVYEYGYELRMRPSNRWGISPALPASANGFLAVLWFFSAYGGWGNEAFCTTAGAVDPGCLHDYALVMRFSLLAAVPAALLIAACAAFVRNSDLLDELLSLSAALWAIALTVLFIGGYIVQ